MAWMFTLLPASFAGIGFDVKSVDDAGKNLLVKSAYPYRSGADVENLGRDTHAVPMEIVLWNEDETGNYEQTLKDLCNAFDSLTPSELVHPIFGVMQVYAEDWKVHHSEDEYDYCTVSVTFVEAGADMPFFNRSLPSALGGLAGLQCLSVLDDLLNQYERYMDLAGAYLGLLSTSVLRDYWDRLLNPLFALRNDVTRAVRDVFAMPREACGDVLALFGVLYGSDKANFVINRPAETPQAISGTGVSVAPSAGFASGFSPNFTREIVVRDVTAMQSSTASAVANVSTDDLNKIPDARGYDELHDTSTTSVADAAFIMRTTLWVADAVCAAQTVAQVLEWELIDPTLSPSQVEDALNAARAPIKMVLDDAKSAFGIEFAESLQTLAWQLTAAARTIINLRPALITHEVVADTNLHLLAFKLYGDFKRAYEIARLNPSIKNPNVVRAGDVLYVYAA